MKKKELEKQIKELFARDLQLRKIVRYWISEYPVKNLLIMNALDPEEEICFFKLPRDEK